MFKWIRHLLLLSSILVLAACGGGGGGGTTDGGGGGATPVSVTLSGLVYDEELANAEVEVFIGTDTIPIATGTSDTNGEYSFLVNVDANRTGEICIIRARRGPASLETFPGVVQDVADAADDFGNVSASSLPTLNVTNITTAQVALIRWNSGGSLPTTSDTIAAARTDLQGQQQEVLNIAAAIKLIIDSGVALPAGINSTQELAAAIASGSNTSFLVDNADAIASAIIQIESDPVLAEQVLTAAVVTQADLEGSAYAVGEDTLLKFAADGTIKIFDYETLTTNSPELGTWTLAYPNLSINFTGGDGLSYAVAVNILGGNRNAIRGTVVINDVSEGEQLFRRVVTDTAVLNAHLGRIAFSTVTGLSVEMPAACAGAGTDLAYIRTDVAETPMLCEQHEGTFMLTPSGLADPVLVLIPLTGTDLTAGVLNQAVWRRPNLDTDEVETFYRRMRVGVSRALPEAGAVSMRIDTSGLLTISETYEQGGLFNRVHRMRYNLELQEDEKVGVVRQLTLASRNGVDVVKGVLDGSLNNITYVYGLTGGTPNQIGYAGQLFTPDNAALTSVARIQYPMEPITAADISGKSFDARDLEYDADDIIIFNADGTGVYRETADGVSVDGLFAWAIDSGVGTLVITVDDEGEPEYIVMYKAKLDLGAGNMLVGGFSDRDVFGMRLRVR